MELPRTHLSWQWGPDGGQDGRATDHSASVPVLCFCETQIAFDGFGHPCKVWNVGICDLPNLLHEAWEVRGRMQETHMAETGHNCPAPSGGGLSGGEALVSWSLQVKA